MNMIFMLMVAKIIITIVLKITMMIPMIMIVIVIEDRHQSQRHEDADEYDIDHCELVMMKTTMITQAPFSPG